MKIGMPMSRTDLDAPLAEHFGKAEWLLVLDPPGRCAFIRNTGVHGSDVARALAERGCTDVIARHIGPGAYAHVAAAGMRAWEGEAGVTARVLAERLASAELRPLAPGDGAHGHAHPRPPRGEPGRGSPP